MQLGMIGLGRMGASMVRRLLRDGHECLVHDLSTEAMAASEKDGATPFADLKEFVAALDQPRVIWIMVPAAVVGKSIGLLVPLLTEGDIIIDGGNSYYRDDIDRAAQLAQLGIHHLDVGTSGGVFGENRGYCLMIGGETEVVKRVDPVFRTLAPGKGLAEATPGREALGGTSEEGYLHCGPNGAGHFVKMVHNGIEYGMMAAMAEGINILKHANIGKADHAHDAETTPMRNPEYFQFDLNLADVTEVWRRGSVISSWLLDLTAAAFAKDPVLEGYSGHVSDSGEGRWTVQAAIEEAVPAHVITASLYERFDSRGEAEFQNKILSAMRFGFGGHHERKAE